MRIAAPLLLGVVAASCATSEEFIPTEHATGISPQGYTAADYEMVAKGEHLGDAMVWSDGAYRSRVDGRPTVVHVGFRVENDTDQPIQVDPSDIRIHVQSKGRTIRRSKPDYVEGSRTIEPGKDGNLSLYFVMPDGVSPRDVDGFRVEWSARAGDLVYNQRTPFMEQPEPLAYYQDPYYSPLYYSPFYDPFFYSPFSYRPLIVRPGPYRHYHHPTARR